MASCTHLTLVRNYRHNYPAERAKVVAEVEIAMHLLKYKYHQEKRSNSWKGTIREYRCRLRITFKDSPSLKPYFQEVFTECYQDARKQASDQTGLSLDTFPVESPLTADECLDEDFLPD